MSNIAIAKRLVKQTLDRHGVEVLRMKARTLSFMDLARGHGVFIVVTCTRPVSLAVRSAVLQSVATAAVNVIVCYKAEV